MSPWKITTFTQRQGSTQPDSVWEHQDAEDRNQSRFIEFQVPDGPYFGPEGGEEEYLTGPFGLIHQEYIKPLRNFFYGSVLPPIPGPASNVQSNSLERPLLAEPAYSAPSVPDTAISSVESGGQGYKWQDFSRPPLERANTSTAGPSHPSSQGFGWIVPSATPSMPPVGGTKYDYQQAQSMPQPSGTVIPSNDRSIPSSDNPSLFPTDESRRRFGFKGGSTDTKRGASKKPSGSSSKGSGSGAKRGQSSSHIQGYAAANSSN